MSPSTLAECWKEAEQSSMGLREKTIELLKLREVRRNCLIYGVQSGWKNWKRVCAVL